MKLNALLFVSLAFLFSFISCSSDKVIKRDATKKLAANNKIFTGNKQYYYTIKSHTETSSEVDGKEILTINSSEIGLVYRITEDSSGNLLLTVTFDRLHYTKKTPDIEEDIDASKVDDSSDPVKRMLGILKGSSLYIRLDKKGDILSASSYDTIIQRIIQISGNQTNAMKKQIEQQMSQIVGDDFIKNVITSNFKALPDSSIYVGDSWNVKSIQSAGLSFELNTQNTFTSLENGIATIESESDISNPSSNKIAGSSLDGLGNIEIDIRGKQIGKTEIDVATKMVIKNVTTGNIKGTVNTVGNNQIPIIIKTRKEIIGKIL